MTAAVLLLLLPLLEEEAGEEGENASDEDDEKAAAPVPLLTLVLADAATPRARSAIAGLRPQTIVAFLEEAQEEESRIGEQGAPVAPLEGDDKGGAAAALPPPPPPPRPPPAREISRSLAGPSPTSTAETPRRSSRPAAAAHAKRSRTALCASPRSEEAPLSALEEGEARSARAMLAAVESGALLLPPPRLLPEFPDPPLPSSVCVLPPPRGPYASTHALNPPRAALLSGATASA